MTHVLFDNQITTLCGAGQGRLVWESWVSQLEGSCLKRPIVLFCVLPPASDVHCSSHPRGRAFGLAVSAEGGAPWSRGSRGRAAPSSLQREPNLPTLHSGVWSPDCQRRHLCHGRPPRRSALLQHPKETNPRTQTSRQPPPITAGSQSPLCPKVPPGGSFVSRLL